MDESLLMFLEDLIRKTPHTYESLALILNIPITKLKHHEQLTVRNLRQITELQHMLKHFPK